MDKIKQLIQQKIEEHKLEIDGSENFISQMKSKSAKDKKQDIESTMKLGILKDKMIFHKSAILVLQDLLDEI